MYTFHTFNLARVESKSDTVDFLNGECDAIYTGSESDITVVFDDDTTCTFTAVPKGTVLPIKAKRINSTNTGSGPFVALYRK
jgi:hypothetical protein